MLSFPKHALLFMAIINVASCMTQDQDDRYADTELEKVENCQIREGEDYSGQLRFFHGIVLKIPECSVLWDVELAKTDPPLAKVLAPALDLKPHMANANAVFLDVTFRGINQGQGNLLVTNFSDVSRAENPLPELSE